MSTFVPKNAAVWFEIPVSSLAKGKAFYEAVTQMEVKEDSSGPQPMAIFQAKDMAEGVAGHLYEGEPSKGGGNTVHLAVPDKLEDALVRVREHKGKVVSDIISIPGGRFAYCQDPDGNSVGLYTPSA